MLIASCEESEAYMDAVANEARGAAAEGEVLIAVVRLGGKETSAKLNPRRMVALKKFFTKRDLPARSVVVTQGERAIGPGRVEFYVSGRLFRTMLLRHGSGVCIECCNPAPEDFLRYRKPKKRRA